MVNRPPISGPAATAIAPAEAVGPGTISPTEVGRDQRDHRRHDQRCTNPLQQRPADQQRGQILGERGEQRATPIDHAADRERPLAAPDLTDLPAGDHQ